MPVAVFYILLFGSIPLFGHPHEVRHHHFKAILMSGVKGPCYHYSNPEWPALDHKSGNGPCK